MKRFLQLVAIAIITFGVQATSAQNLVDQVKNGGPRSIGLRLGYGAAISYQHTVANSNFVQVDLGFPKFNAIDLSAKYNWAFNIEVGSGVMNWFAGVGAGLGVGFGGGDGDGGYFAASAIPVIGLEYAFEEAPIQLAIDYAPNIGFSIGGGRFGFYGGWYNAALSIRYIF